MFFLLEFLGIFSKIAADKELELLPKNTGISCQQLRQNQ